MSARSHFPEQKPPSTRPPTHGCPNTRIDRNCTLEEALKTNVNLYHQYAPRENKDDYLSFKDFSEFMHDQAPTFLDACGRNCPGYLETLFKKMDVDRSGHLTFDEFVPVLMMVIDDNHRISHGEDRCGPDRD
ncbi:hypothetical protein lerEdw1_002964 [Lerista edwardsae]|nr:hypothetical protein lerEdw1_002964 [Lerista edwardsae]